MSNTPISQQDLYQKIFHGANPSELTVEQVVEATLQIDLGMYDQLPAHWQNPGMAGVCAWQIMALALTPQMQSCPAAVQKLIRAIPIQIEQALVKLEQWGPNALVKKIMLHLYEHAGGFWRITLDDTDFQPLKSAISDLSCQGQLVYRKSDGRFFVLIDDAYRERLVKKTHDFLPTTAAVGHAHITVNEGMKLTDNQAWYQTLLKEYGEDPAPLFQLACQAYVALNCRPTFKFIGAYRGIPKSNPRTIETIHLQVESDLLNDWRQRGLGPIYDDYTYHMTFAEKSRAPHSIMTEDNLLVRVMPKDDSLAGRLRTCITVPTPACVRVYAHWARESRQKGADAESLRYIDTAQQLIEEIPSLEPEEKTRLLAPFAFERASHHYFAGPAFIKEAVASIEHACQGFELEPDSKEKSRHLAECNLLRFKIYYRQKKVKQAKDYLIESKKHIRECSKAKVLKAEYKLHLSKIYIDEGNYTDAEQEALKSVNLFSQGQASSRIELAWAHVHCADVYLAQGNYIRAKYELQTALAIYEAHQVVQRSIHPASTQCLLRLGRLALKTSQPKAALRYFAQTEQSLLYKEAGRERLLSAVYFNMGEAYHQQKKWQKAESKYRLSLLLDERNHEGGNYYVVETKVKLATLYFDQANYAKASALYQDCLKYFEAYPTRSKSQLGFDAQLALVRCQLAIAHTQDKQTRINRATALLDKLITWQVEVFKHDDNTILDETLIDLDRLLKLRAQCDLRLDDPASAAIRYKTEASKRWEHTPIVAWRWSSEGIQYAKLYKENKAVLGDCYRIRADIAKANGCHQLALRQYLKAQKLGRRVKPAVTRCQETIQKNQRNLGNEYYSQLTAARELLLKIRLDFISAQSAKQILSKHSRSRVMDFMIKIRSLLDISFNRLCQEIWTANGDNQQHVYFPYTDSEEELQSILIDNKLMGYLEFDKVFYDKLKSEKTIFKSVINFLMTEGYLDKKRCATSKVDESINLNTLDPKFSPLRAALTSVLETASPGDALMEKLQPILKAGLNSPPPPMPLLIERLQAVNIIKFIKGVPHVDFSELNDVCLDLSRSDDDPTLQAQLEAYTPRIFAVLSAHRLVHLREKQYADVYEALCACQPYAYYDRQHPANQSDGQYWQESWLEKLCLLQNISKHFSPVQPRQNHRLSKRTSGLAHNELRILAPYSVRDLNPWCFAPIIQAKERLALSYDLSAWLEQENIIFARALQDPLLTQSDIWAEVASRDTTQATLTAQLTDRLKQQAASLQPEPAWLPYLPAVAQYLVKKARQQHDGQAEPDQEIDLLNLMQRSLDGASQVVEIISAKVLANPHSLPDKKADDSHLSSGKSSDKKRDKLCRRELPFVTRTLRRLVNDVQRVSEDVGLQLRKNQTEVDKAILTLHKYAQDLSGDIAWLALRYYAQAIKWTCYSRLVDHHVSALLNDACETAHRLGYHNMAETWCGRIGRWAYQQQRQIEQPKAMRHHSKHRSLSSTSLDDQLCYISESVADLRYQIFKLFMKTDDELQLHRVQNQVIELTISMRHFLDYLLGHFINHILHPIPHAPTTQVDFPCVSDEASLRQTILDFCRARVGDDTLDEKTHPLWQNSAYEMAYHVITTCQPFSDLDGQHCWLAYIQAISNKFKHERASFPDAKALSQHKARVDNIADFYVIPNPKDPEGSKQFPIIPLLDVTLRNIQLLHQVISRLDQNLASTPPLPSSKVPIFVEHKGKGELDPDSSEDSSDDNDKAEAVPMLRFNA